MFQFLGDSKLRRASKSLHRFKSYVNFGERGDLPSGELHREGSASAACSADLLLSLPPFKEFLLVGETKCKLP